MSSKFEHPDFSMYPSALGSYIFYYHPWGKSICHVNHYQTPIMQRGVTFMILMKHYGGNPLKVEDVIYSMVEVPNY